MFDGGIFLLLDTIAGGKRQQKFACNNIFGDKEIGDGLLKQMHKDKIPPVEIFNHKKCTFSLQRQYKKYEKKIY